MERTVLILEDNLDLLEIYSDLLDLEGIKGLFYSEIEKFRDFVLTRPRLGCVFLDCQLQHQTTFHLMRLCRDLSVSPHVVAMSGHLNDDFMDEARAAGANHFASKPFDILQMLHKLLPKA